MLFIVLFFEECIVSLLVLVFYDGHVNGVTVILIISKREARPTILKNQIVESSLSRSEGIILACEQISVGLVEKGLDWRCHID